LYESWNENKRLLVYYEELLLHPKEELTRILNFLGEPLTYLDAFMAEYEDHKATCLQIYKFSSSKGKDVLHHSRKTDKKYRESVDGWIASLYPEWWHKYLKDHYAEDCLNYSKRS
jgi:hypothetical protein